jgi:Uma2 family endonuclease
MSGITTRRAFTVDEFLKLDQIHFFGPEERLELIDGEIRAMSPINPRHAAIVGDLVTFFHGQLGKDWLVRGQTPIRLQNDSLPQPDVCILKAKADRYSKAHPTAKETALVIEVADTSIYTDLGRKKEMYATAGIPEYWVFDLGENILECFRNPQDGVYQNHSRLQAKDCAKSTALGTEVPLAEFLSPA